MIIYQTAIPCLSATLILESHFRFRTCNGFFNPLVIQMAEKINRLKLVLVEKDISQKEFAEKLNVSSNTISRICRNETQPSLKLLREMAVALDVELWELLVPIKKRN